jgi:hypothetical protein
MRSGGRFPQPRFWFTALLAATLGFTPQAGPRAESESASLHAQLERDLVIAPTGAATVRLDLAAALRRTASHE